MKSFCRMVVAALLAAPAATAQSSMPYEIGMMKRDINYLASDALEGRRTGTKGEALARTYLEKRYRQMDIPAWKGSYTQPFTFVRGKKIGSGTELILSGKTHTDSTKLFPMPWSASMPAPIAKVVPLFKDTADLSNPHFDWEKEAYEQAKTWSRAGVAGVVFTVPTRATSSIRFNTKSDWEPLPIAAAVLFTDETPAIVSGDRIWTVVVQEQAPSANVAAYLDNKAPYTIVIGAHYDHLGHGEDGNSLLANASQLGQIHNGADDNASGTAGLLMLAQRIRNEGKKNYNYLFVHFSGEELGLLGSKAFVKQFGLDSTNTAAMINLDMIGRLPDSNRAVQVGGVGTSPVWDALLPRKQFKVVVDSSGIGPSDHTSFYTAGIPVLFFFTGAHSDYHKPSDDADKINYLGIYEIIQSLDGMLTKIDGGPKPLFTPTKQTAVNKVRFKVTLGIMPDYSFTEGGVKVDGVTEGRPAAAAGVQTGDILLQLGDFKIGGMQSYMEALGKLKAGMTVPLRLQRNGQEHTVDVRF